MIVAIDPGDTTGVFCTPGTFEQLVEFNVINLLDEKHELYSIDHVVLEKFNLYDTRSKANAGWALNVIGAVTYWCWANEVPLTGQWNRDKNQVSDTRLDELGILCKPKTKWRHANDAARHYVYFMNRKNNR